MGKQTKAYLYAAATVLCWSTVASAFKISLRYQGVLTLLVQAAAVSTLIFFVFLAGSRRLGLLGQLSRGDYLCSAALGFLNPFLYYVVLFKAYSLLPAQQAQPINFLWPITLVLLSVVILGQRISGKDIAAVLISFFGVVVISTQGRLRELQFTSGKGVLLALGSTVIWSLYWVCNLRDRKDPVVRLFLNFAFGTVFVFAAWLVWRDPRPVDVKGVLGAIYVGVFEMGVTFLLWLQALRLSQTTARVTGLIYLVPFISLGIISVAVGEKIRIWSVLGLVLIVTGIVLQKARLGKARTADGNSYCDEQVRSD